MSYEARTERRYERVLSEGERLCEEITEGLQTIYADELDLMEFVKYVAEFEAPIDPKAALSVLKSKAHAILAAKS